MEQGRIKNAKVIKNECGTAPGIIIEDKDSGEVLGSKTIVLEDKAGNYSIKEIE